MQRDIAGPSFFEGMLLGNGDVGACVVVRQDALGIHIGKNDCWDIRVSEDSAEAILPFSDLLDLWRRAGEEAKEQGKPDMIFLERHIDFFHEYNKKAINSYSQKWPRPWPCGTIWLNWDLRQIRILQYRLDPSNGLFTLDLESFTPEGQSRTVQLTAIVDRATGVISVVTDKPLELFSVVYSPEVDKGNVFGISASENDVIPGSAAQAAERLPAPDTKVDIKDSYATLSCFQHCPATAPTDKKPSSLHPDKDRNFSLFAKTMGKWSIGTADVGSDLSILPAGAMPILPASAVSLKPAGAQVLRLDVFIATPRDVLLSKLEK